MTVYLGRGKWGPKFDVGDAATLWKFQGLYASGMWISGACQTQNIHNVSLAAMWLIVEVICYMKKYMQAVKPHICTV